MAQDFFFGHFLRRSLRHHGRSHVAVGLGVIVAAMVIGGALIVGDSVRDSLTSLTLSRLARVDFGLVTHRFFREASVAALAQQPEFMKRFESAAPALVFPASVERRASRANAEAAAASTARTRSGGILLYGLDQRLWSMLDTAGTQSPSGKGIVLNSRLAEQLGAGVGDSLTLWVELPPTIPRDSLLGGQEEQTTQEIRVTVAAVLPEQSGAGRFDLQPSQQFPKVAFVDLQSLQTELNLEEVTPSRRNKIGKPARVNALFVTARDVRDATTASSVDAANVLTNLLRDSVTLDDLILRLVAHPDRGYWSLESERMILEDSLADAAKRVAAKQQLVVSPVLAYLVNLIWRDGDDKKFSKYSIVAGVPDPVALPKEFGPIATLDGSSPPSIDAGSLLISEWLASDLGISAGDVTAENRPCVRLTFHKVGSRGELPEEEKLFEVRGVLPIAGKLAGDRGLTPEVPGITDAETFRDWDQPFPMKLPVTERDEEYWDKYRATPKAFFEIDAARAWWSSRYGSQTSLRLAPKRSPALPSPESRMPNASQGTDPTTKSGELTDEARQRFEYELLRSLDLATLGFGIQPFKWFGLRAAGGTTDFAGLFIGFSLFMILSGLMLISLLVRLGIERRAAEIGLLSAVGWSRSQVSRVLLGEQFAVVLIGGVLGIASAVGYAGLLIHGLRTWWVGAVGTTLLSLSVRPLTLLIGFVLTILVAGASAWWGLRGLRRLSPRELLAGQTSAIERDEQRQRRRERSARWSNRFALFSVVAIVAVIGLGMPAKEAFAGLSWSTVLFFIVGIGLLTSLLLRFAAWLDGDRFDPLVGPHRAALIRMSLRNATRQRQRSLLSLALIACATFLLVAVAAGRRNPAVETPDPNSGNGGFLFVAESTAPLIHDLGTAAGRVKLGALGKTNSRYDAMRVAPFRVRLGENASCLNLYQTRLPTILGVPQGLNGFKFVSPPRGVNSPWKLLDAEQPDGTIPVVGDMNTLMYSLHKGIGETLAMPDESNPKARLKLVGMLDSSVFQGVLLMSEKNFLRLFPEQAGFRYFLIGDRRFEPSGAALSKSEARELSDQLETELAQYGFDVEPIGDRLANFLAVQNTYLSTFQTLGGLGLLLGTIGLGTVMLRNVLERRSELALLRAVGFRSSSIRWLVLLENAFLLICGLSAGTVSALLALLPHLLSTGADTPWRSGVALLAGLFAVGLLSASAATRESVKSPIVASLRGD